MEDNEDRITRQRLRALSKFDYYWKITLIILLVIGFGFMLNEWKQINTNSYSCTTQPFIYGARVMADKQPNGHMECSCTVSGDSYTRPYSFNEEQENQDLSTKEINVFDFINNSP